MLQARSWLCRRLYSSKPRIEEAVESSIQKTAASLQDRLSKLELPLTGQAATRTELEQQDIQLREQLKLMKAQVVMKQPEPLSPSLRWYRWPVYPYLHKGGPFKRLTVRKVSQSGRNNTGKITVRHKGGGHQRRIRIIDFFRTNSEPKTVVRLEYDPNRSAHIALLKEAGPENEELYSYIIAPMGMRAGDTVRSFREKIPDDYMQQMEGTEDPGILAQLTVRRGNCLPLRLVPLGTVVHNVGITAGGPAKFCRSAGTYARLYEKLPEKKRALIKLSSGETRYVSLDACATVGIVSNPDHQHRSLGKAGRSRNLGIRPTVRGTAMNKVDHPHGGGRGKSKGNKIPVSKWGKLTKAGHKTRVGKHVNKELVTGRPRGRQGAI